MDISIPGSGSIDSVEWDLGIPSHQTESCPCVTYANKNELAVSLVVWDENGCQDDITSAPAFITIYDPPDPSFFADPVSTCLVPLTTTITNTTFQQPGTVYAWDFPGAGVSPSSSNQFDPGDVIYTQQGTYDITLTTTDNICSKDTTYEDVIVSGCIDIVSDAAGGCVPLDICFGLDIVNLPSGESINTVNWSAPGGSPTSATDIVFCTTYSIQGEFTVTADVTFNGSLDPITISKVVEVGELPSLTAEVLPGDVCINECVFGSATSDILNTEFSWYFEAPGSYVNGGVGLQSAVGYCYTDEWQQPITILMVGENNGCVDTVEMEVFVNPPAAQFEWEQLCPLTQINFTVNDGLGLFTDDGAWYVDGSPTPIHTFNDIADANFTYDFGIAGAYEVQLVLSSSLTGCSDSVSQAVTVGLGVITNDVIANSEQERDCPPLTVDFGTLDPCNAPDSIYWYLQPREDPLITYPPHQLSHTYTEVGPENEINGCCYYDLIAVVYFDECRADSIVKDNYIRVGDGPQGSVSLEPTTGVPPLTVTFNFEDIEQTDSIKFNSGIDSQFIVLPGNFTPLDVTYETIGEFHPEVILCSEDCVPLTLSMETIVVSNVTGLFNYSTDEVGIYPNPVRNDELLYWSTVSNQEFDHMKIVDLSGRVLIESWGGISSPVRMDNLSPGLYGIILKSKTTVAVTLFEVVK